MSRLVGSARAAKTRESWSSATDDLLVQLNGCVQPRPAVPTLSTIWLKSDDPAAGDETDVAPIRQTKARHTQRTAQRGWSSRVGRCRDDHPRHPEAVDAHAERR